MNIMSNTAVSFSAFSRKTLLMLGAVIVFAASGFVGSAQAQRVIRATNGTAQPGQQVTIFVQLDSQGNESSTSFSMNYNAQVLTNPQITLGNGVPPSSNLGTNNNNAAQGQIGILVDSTNTYTAGTRNILNVTFTVAPGATLGQYPVTFGSVPTPQSVSSAAGALLPTTYAQGIIQVGSTAAGVEVAGRVLTPDGRGIRNATVVITDAKGLRRTVTTSSFGIYRFDDVQAGETYTISVQSKQFRFTARILQVVDSLTDFDFVGQQ